MAAESIQVPIQGLTPLYTQLAGALKGMGMTEAQLQEALEQGVQARCAQCGTLLSGEDLGRLSAADPSSPPADPRIGRLVRGYCAGKDCSSNYYQVEFMDAPNVDWGQIRAQAEQSGDRSPGPGKEPKDSTPKAARPPVPWRRVGIGLGVILFLLLVRFIYLHGYVPVVQRPQNFAVDPASTNFPGNP
jgi:hypothetical protein